MIKSITTMRSKNAYSKAKFGNANEPYDKYGECIFKFERRKRYFFNALT